MKRIIPASCGAIILALLTLYACNKSSVSIDPLVGKYVISSTTLANDFIYNKDTLLPAGTDLTVAINAALLASASCSNPVDTRLELKNNGQIWYDCEGENNNKQNGTWEINAARTELTLTLNVPINSINAAVPLKISNLQVSAIQVSGSTTIPLPPDFFLAFGVDLTKSGVPVFQTAIHIEITRTP